MVELHDNITFTHGTQNVEFFKKWHPEQPLNPDGTITTHIYTCVCMECGIVEISMLHTPVAMWQYKQHAQGHSDLCLQCEEELPDEDDTGYYY